MGKSKKTAVAATPTPKGGKRQTSIADLYAVEMHIWEESTVKKEMLIKLHEDGLLSEKHLGEWKAPGNHRVPELKEGEIVLFTPFVEKGLGLPASDFFSRIAALLWHSYESS